MGKIMAFDRRQVLALAQIDLESEHQNTSKLYSSISFNKKEILKRFEKGRELFFGYKEDGEIKGYATLKLDFPGYNHCEIYWLAVKRKHHGQGIGTKLVEFIEKYSKRKGFRKVCLYTGKNMKKTRNFYEKLGYKYVNEFPDYYGFEKGNKTAVLYTKNIAPNKSKY